MIFTHTPLEKMRQTQPYGVDWTCGNLPLGDGKTGGYAALGLKGHNGLDLSLSEGNGTAGIAVADGFVESDGSFESGYGLNIRLFVDFGETRRLEVVYGHLRKVLKTGPVKAGDKIVECNNSGISTGPHLHLGTRFQKAGAETSWNIENYNNGYFGYIDPMQFFKPDVLDLPVDKQYGLTARSQGVPSEIAFFPSVLFFYKTQKRLISTREYKGLRFGFWPLRDIIDPAMFPIWSEMSYPAAKSKGIVK